jgi:hypothetical protein
VIEELSEAPPGWEPPPTESEERREPVDYQVSELVERVEYHAILPCDDRPDDGTIGSEEYHLEKCNVLRENVYQEEARNTSVVAEVEEEVAPSSSTVQDVPHSKQEGIADSIPDPKIGRVVDNNSLRYA